MPPLVTQRRRKGVNACCAPAVNLPDLESEAQLGSLLGPLGPGARQA